MAKTAPERGGRVECTRHPATAQVTKRAECSARTGLAVAVCVAYRYADPVTSKCLEIGRLLSRVVDPSRVQGCWSACGSWIWRAGRMGTEVNRFPGSWLRTPNSLQAKLP